MPTLIKKGDRAKEFTLKDQNDKDVQLSDLQEKKVILSFHPLAWTSVCAEQMKALEAHKKKFDALKTVALGISIDTVPSKSAWAKELGIKNTLLLSDFWPHGKVAKTYGVLRSDGVTERALFIIDKKGVIRYIDVHNINQRPSLEVLVEELDKLK